MSETLKDTRMRRSQAKTHAEVKSARLQAALRENLRRRKAANVTSDEVNAPDHEKANPNES